MNKLLLSLLLCIGISNLSARNHKVDIAATLMSTPQVFSKDLHEESVQMGYFMNLGEVLAKSLNIAQKDMHKLSIQDKVKLATYGLAAVYDLYIMTNPEEVVKLAEENRGSYRKVKRVQQAQLLLEVALRAAAFYMQHKEEHKTADLGVEAADFVGMSRLLSRHWPDLMADAPATPENIADQLPEEKRVIKFNEPTLTTSTEVVEAPKLSLLRDEGVSASLGTKTKQKRSARKVLQRPVEPVENPHKKTRTLQERLAEAQAYSKYKEDLAAYHEQQTATQDTEEVVEDPYKGWSGNPKDGWLRAPAWGSGMEPCEEYRAWQKWYANNKKR